MAASFITAPALLRRMGKFPMDMETYYSILDLLDSVTKDDWAFIWRRLPYRLKDFWFREWRPV